MPSLLVSKSFPLALHSSFNFGASYYFNFGHERDCQSSIRSSISEFRDSLCLFVSCRLAMFLSIHVVESNWEILVFLLTCLMQVTDSAWGILLWVLHAGMHWNLELFMHAHSLFRFSIFFVLTTYSTNKIGLWKRL